MPFLADDRLDPAQSHGDLLLALSADQPDMLLHALRQLMRRTRDNLVLHLMLDGYNRNLLGFKDGTANLDVGDRRLMDELVWVGPDDGEPAWAVGGSYQAVRIIRMFVEFWDRTPLIEQQKIIGRDKAGGAPLGLDREHDDPGYGEDPAGHRVPPGRPHPHGQPAHPRDRRQPHPAPRLQLLARLRRPRAARPGPGLRQLPEEPDQGVPRRAGRLEGEPPEEYILPVGGGFFFVLPGVPSGDGWLGQQLLA